MTILHTISLFVASGVTGVLMVGCATNQTANQPGTITEWTGNFHTVQLQSSGDGSKSSNNRAQYRIVMSSSDRQTLTIKSGLRASDFTPKPLYDAKEVVRVIEGSDEHFMIIEEAPSNDNWPYKNYILISSSKNGHMNYKYLWVPEVAHEGTALDPSTILRLQGSVLTFRYANGTEATRNLDDIRSSSEPPPHG